LNQAFIAVHFDQLAIDADRGAAGGEAQHGVPTCPPALHNYLGDAPGDGAGDLFVLDDDEGDAFSGGGHQRCKIGTP
jgi:hypothetical protein